MTDFPSTWHITPETQAMLEHLAAGPASSTGVVEVSTASNTAVDSSVGYPETRG